MGFWTSTALAFGLSAITPALQEGPPKPDDSVVDPAAVHKSVVFHFKAVLYPDRNPLFRLVANDGTVFTTQLPAYRSYDLLDEMFSVASEDYIGPYFGWVPCVFEQVPKGSYTFEAYSGTDQLILQIPGIEVAYHPNYGCYPPQLQGLRLEEQEFIRLAFQKPNGELFGIHPLADHRVRVVKQTESGYELCTDRICEEGKLRISKKYLSPDYWLILPAHHPIALDGLEDGDVIGLEATPYVEYHVPPADHWPEDCYCGPYLAPPQDPMNLLRHQMMVNYSYSEGFVPSRFYIPTGGEYEVWWNVYTEQEHSSPSDVSRGLFGGPITLTHTDPPTAIRLPIPNLIKAQAWVRRYQAHLIGTPIIEMTGESPSRVKIPPPPPGFKIGSASGKE
jgi:hypothetical protein